ncbi:MAG: hypothetical protein HQ593_01525 [Candidatus Omnitrophica bacterium]|nr:hypothetical protein [Candidatus Omnitrophota bacterium]
MKNKILKRILGLMVLCMFSITNLAWGEFSTPEHVDDVNAIGKTYTPYDAIKEDMTALAFQGTEHTEGNMSFWSGLQNLIEEIGATLSVQVESVIQATQSVTVIRASSVTNGGGATRFSAAGTFQAAGTGGLGSIPEDGPVGDIDGDGKPDFLCPGGDEENSVVIPEPEEDESKITDYQKKIEEIWDEFCWSPSPDIQEIMDVVYDTTIIVDEIRDPWFNARHLGDSDTIVIDIGFIERLIDKYGSLDAPEVKEALEKTLAHEIGHDYFAKCDPEDNGGYLDKNDFLNYNPRHQFLFKEHWADDFVQIHDGEDPTPPELPGGPSLIELLETGESREEDLEGLLLLLDGDPPGEGDGNSLSETGHFPAGTQTQPDTDPETAYLVSNEDETSDDANKDTDDDGWTDDIDCNPNDHDNDGIDDDKDLDDDNDGIFDVEDLHPKDHDNDGFQDKDDPDDDNDGVDEPGPGLNPAYPSIPRDTHPYDHDNDGEKDNIDNDDDNDGTSDVDDPHPLDFDNDGINNHSDFDDDNDGIDDWKDKQPYDNNNNGIPDHTECGTAPIMINLTLPDGTEIMFEDIIPNELLDPTEPFFIVTPITPGEILDDHEDENK